MHESHFNEDYLECEERFREYQRRRTFIEKSLPLITGGLSVTLDKDWFDRLSKALEDYEDGIASLPDLLTDTEFSFLSRLSTRVHELLEYPPEVPRGLEDIWKGEEPG